MRNKYVVKVYHKGDPKAPSRIWRWNASIRDERTQRYLWGDGSWSNAAPEYIYADFLWVLKLNVRRSIRRYEKNASGKVRGKTYTLGRVRD